MSLCLFELNKLWGQHVFSSEHNLNMPIGFISTDSRTLNKGDFYVPLVGDKYDGHEFLGEVFERGAQATIVSYDFALPIPQELLHWRVDNTLLAYQQLSLLHRSHLDATIIAVTGSAGKTTKR